MEKIMKNTLLLSLSFLLSCSGLFAMELPEKPVPITKKFETLLSLSRKQFDSEIKNHPDVLKQRTEKGDSLLGLAVKQNKIQHIKTLLVLEKHKIVTKEDECEVAVNNNCLFRALKETRSLELARIILKKRELKDRYVLSYDYDNLYDDSFAFFVYHYNKSNDPLFNALLLADYKTMDEIFSKDPSKRNEVIQTTHAAHCTPLARAKAFKDKEVIEYLEKKGAKDVYNACQSLLGEDIIKQDISSIKYWLEKGASINNADSKGLAPIHWACIYGRADMVAYLIQRGANVNMVDRDKARTPLRWTLRMHERSVDKGGRQMTTRELLPCFFLLTAAGADSRIQDIYGHNVSYWMLRQGFNEIEDNLISSMIYMNRNRKDVKERNYSILENILLFQIKALTKQKHLTDDEWNALIDSDPTLVAILDTDGITKYKKYFDAYLPDKSVDNKP